MSLDVPTFTPSTVKKPLIKCFKAQLVPLLRSSPGLGKSSLMREIADEFALEYVDVRLAQRTPEDLLGLPMKIEEEGQLWADFIPFKTFPLAHTPIPEGKAGWLIHFEELVSANRAVQVAAYQILLEREINGRKIHPNVLMAASGNLDTDKAIVNPLSTALQSRLIHLQMEASLADFRAIAPKLGIDYRIMGFLEFQPHKLHVFDPDHDDRTFPCPRTWEFTSRLIKDEVDVDPWLGLLTGTIGAGVAVEFAAFCKLYHSLPKLDDILTYPDRALIPSEASARFATLSFVIESTKMDNYLPILDYIKRFPEELQVVYYRSMFQRLPKMRDDPKVASHLFAIMKFLNDD